MRKGTGALVLGFLLLASQSACADPPRKYVTLSAAHGTAGVDIGGYDNVTIVTLDAEYHVTSNLGLAIGLRSFEDFEANGVSSASLELDGAELDVVLNHRPIDRLMLKGKLGVMRYDLTAHALGREIGEEQDYATTLGVGAQFEFNQWVGMQLDARRAFDVSDANVDWVTLGVFVRLGPRVRK